MIAPYVGLGMIIDVTPATGSAYAVRFADRSIRV